MSLMDGSHGTELTEVERRLKRRTRAEVAEHQKVQVPRE